MANQAKNSPKFHIVMFPWLAMGHMTPYLHLSNKLAERGHKISFLLPNKAQLLLQPLNLHPSLITFHPISIPHVDGLPLGTQTASDVPISHVRFLATALDLTRPQVEHIIAKLNPNFVFYDFAHWVPEVTLKLGIKSVSYQVVSAASLSRNFVPLRLACHRREEPPTAEELLALPSGYPPTKVVLRKHEAYKLTFLAQDFGSGVTFFKRINTSLMSADAIALRTLKEIEGNFCNYLSSQFQKPVLLTGPVLPDSNTEPAALDEKWDQWLKRHEPGSVVYCSFGSQFVFEKDQFQEILLGFELTGYPFFVALKPPIGCSSIEEALPKGYKERVKGRGAVHGGWVPQPILLNHPTVGCFVSHCGFGSMWESLMSDVQIVLVPEFLPEHILNTRLMAGEMKVAVEVEKEKSGWISKESLCRTVKEAMDKDNEVGRLIRENHAEWRDVLGSHGFMSGYIDGFVHNLEQLLD